MSPSPDVLLAAVRLDPGAAEVERLARLLSDDEQARAARFVFERDRRRYQVARGRLREWLGAQVGVAPVALRFEYGARGKPSLAGGGGPHFSVSHSGERALFGLSWRAPVGVDVEQVRDLDDPILLAERVFAPSERAALVPLAPAARRARFFTTWTRKEAVIKATGHGVAQELTAFSTLGDPPWLVGDPAIGRAADWTLLDVAVEPDYPAAMALIAPDATASPVVWLDVAS